MDIVTKVKKNNPNLTFKQILIKSKELYKKVKKPVSKKKTQKNKKNKAAKKNKVAKTKKIDKKKKKKEKSK